MPQDRFFPEDEEILAAVRALQSGEGRDAFEPIHRRYFRPLRAFFANQSELAGEAEDFAQTVLWKAYQNVPQFRFEGSFAAWLRSIAENVWKNALRDRRAAKRPQLVAAAGPAVAAEGEAAAALSPWDALGGEAPSPEAAALAAERTRRLREAIESLPPGMRRCIELRLFADLKYREISAVTGIGLNSVRSQLFEARARLKPILDEYFQGTEL